MADTRVEKMANRLWGSGRATNFTQAMAAGAAMVNDIEAADLLVIDPANPELLAALATDIETICKWLYIDAKDMAVVVLGFMATWAGDIHVNHLAGDSNV